MGERVIATPRRTGNLVKCRGMLVNTDVVIDLLSGTPGIGQFQIVFSRETGAMDRMLVRIEGQDDASLRDRLAAAIQQAVSLRPDIEFVAGGALYDEARSLKARRVLDLRPPVE
jgi:phenylacetate-CoA ligase